MSFFDIADALTHDFFMGFCFYAKKHEIQHCVLVKTVLILYRVGVKCLTSDK